MRFELELPPELKLSQALEYGTMYFAGIINITYKSVFGERLLCASARLIAGNLKSYLYILLYRPSYLDPSDELKQKEGRLALQAACQCTRILEDMLSQNVIEHGILHL